MLAELSDNMPCILRRRPAGLCVRYHLCNTLTASFCAEWRSWGFPLISSHFLLFNSNFRNPNLIEINITFSDIYDPEFAECISEQIITKDFATSRWLIVFWIIGSARKQAPNDTIQPLPLPLSYQKTCFSKVAEFGMLLKIWYKM